ncbi:MAG TPA: DMT family transporter [Oceanipulchritudo sp.]|nr:DMT family transporter [Oceanipulchritudo sp.]
MGWKATWVLAVGFILFWNSGFIGAEYTLPYADPFTVLFWRYLGLTLLLGGFLMIRRRLRWPGMGAVLISFIIGILSHGVWLGCVFFSLQLGVPAGIVALVVALQPMATGALSGSVTGEPTPWYRWVGLLIGFAGVAVAVLARTDLERADSVLAYALPFVSALAITIASLIDRKRELEVTTERVPIDISLFYQSLGTVLVVALPALFLENLSTRWTPVFIGVMLWLILAVSLVAYSLMWVLVARVDATRVASLFYLGPPVTMIMAWIAFGDRVLVTDLIGLLIVAAGVLLTQSGVKTTRRS